MLGYSQRSWDEEPGVFACYALCGCRDATDRTAFCEYMCCSACAFMADQSVIDQYAV